jgi:hypothetical protein
MSKRNKLSAFLVRFAVIVALALVLAVLVAAFPFLALVYLFTGIDGTSGVENWLRKKGL